VHSNATPTFLQEELRLKQNEKYKSRDCLKIISIYLIDMAERKVDDDNDDDDDGRSKTTINESPIDIE
jgi:hypothetical protein